MLARRTTAEVDAGDENVSPHGVRPVQRKVRVRRTVGAQPPVGEDVVAEAALARHLEKPRRDNLIGVDVVGGEDDVRPVSYTHLMHRAQPRPAAPS